MPQDAPPKAPHQTAHGKRAHQKTSRRHRPQAKAAETGTGRRPTPAHPKKLETKLEKTLKRATGPRPHPAGWILRGTGTLTQIPVTVTVTAILNQLPAMATRHPATGMATEMARGMETGTAAPHLQTEMATGTAAPQLEMVTEMVTATGSQLPATATETAAATETATATATETGTRLRRW